MGDFTLEAPAMIAMTLYSSKFTQFWLVLMQYYLFKPCLCRWTLFSTLHIFPFCFHVAYFIQKQSNTVVNPIISHAHYSHRWVGFKSIPGMVGKSISIMSSLYHHFCSLNHRFPSFLLVKSSDFSFFPWSNPNLSPFLHHSNMVDSC